MVFNFDCPDWMRMWEGSYGPGFMEFIVDVFMITIVTDIAVLLLVTREILKFWKRRNKKGGVEITDENSHLLAGKTNSVGLNGHITQLKQEPSKTYRSIEVQTEPWPPAGWQHNHITTETTITEIKKEEINIEIENVDEQKSSPPPKDEEEVFEQIEIEDANDLNSSQLLQQTEDDNVVHRGEIQFTSGWRKVVRLMDVIQAKLISEKRVRQLEQGTVTIDEVQEELKEYLVGRYPIAGVYNDRTSSKLSLYEAHKQKIISRGTALSLLEAQAGTGSIIDPANGATMNVKEALENGIIDKTFAAVLSRAERAVNGYTVRGNPEVMSLFQAMKKGLVVEKHGIRLLEAQIATGGIIDPVANHRLPVEMAYQRGLFDERLNKILDDPGDDTKGFLDPNTSENLTYLQLISRCIEDKETGFLLLPLVKEEEKHLYIKKRDAHARSLSDRLSCLSDVISRSSVCSLSDDDH